MAALKHLAPNVFSNEVLFNNAMANPSYLWPSDVTWCYKRVLQTNEI